MRKAQLAAAICAVGLCTAVAQAQSDEVLPGMGNKLVRGLVNGITGIVEWPVQTVKGYNNGLSLIENEPTSKAVGTILGFFRGIGHAAGRTVYGGLEVATFWLPNPDSNEGVGVPLDADFAWEQGEQYSIFKPTLKEGLMPYPRKIVRGVANGFAGIAEVPGQIVKGASSGDALVGIPVGAVKGVWFWFGRSANGYADAILFLVPNPPDQVGCGFDEEWPWDALVDAL